MIIFSQSDVVVAVGRIGRNLSAHGIHLLLGGHSDFSFMNSEVMIQLVLTIQRPAEAGAFPLSA
jgi:hypothetical protein